MSVAISFLWCSTKKIQDFSFLIEFMFIDITLGFLRSVYIQCRDSVLSLFRCTLVNLYKAWIYLRKLLFCHTFLSYFLCCAFCQMLFSPLSFSATSHVRQSVMIGDRSLYLQKFPSYGESMDVFVLAILRIRNVWIQKARMKKVALLIIVILNKGHIFSKLFIKIFWQIWWPYDYQ